MRFEVCDGWRNRILRSVCPSSLKIRIIRLSCEIVEKAIEYDVSSRYVVVEEEVSCIRREEERSVQVGEVGQVEEGGVRSRRERRKRREGFSSGERE